MAIGFGLIMFVLGFMIGGLMTYHRMSEVINVLERLKDKREQELDQLYEEMYENKTWDDNDEDMDAIYT